MALKHAIIASLEEQEASGYELSKRFDVSVANFWPATPQQIYGELDRLEADGLLFYRISPGVIRLVTSWQTTDADIDRAVARFAGALGA